MNKRHRARRLALQGLCSLDVQGKAAIDLVLQFVADSDEPIPTLAEARSLLLDVYHSREECDGFLARHARQWELGRLALVDRNILRLATREMLTGQTPVKVVISEALRLAQEFSSAESPRFINGLLDAVAKEIQKGSSGEPAAETPSTETDTDADESDEPETD